MKRKFIFIILISSILACSKDLYDDDRIQIKSYLHEQNIDYIDTLGLYIHISQTGDTLKVSDVQTVKMTYTGKYLDGTIFAQTKDTTSVDLKINTAIAGLRGGLTIFGKNGSGAIYIPSTLGYGDSPPFGVRKNAILVYDVKILDVY